MQFRPLAPLPCLTIDHDKVCHKLNQWCETQAINGEPGEGSMEWEYYIRQLAEEHPSAVVSESEDEDGPARVEIVQTILVPREWNDWIQSALSSHWTIGTMRQVQTNEGLRTSWSKLRWEFRCISENGTRY